MFISVYHKALFFFISRRCKHIHLIIWYYLVAFKRLVSKYAFLSFVSYSIGCTFITFLILAGTINALSTALNVLFDSGTIRFFFEFILWTHSSNSSIRSKKWIKNYSIVFFAILTLSFFLLNIHSLSFSSASASLKEKTMCLLWSFCLSRWKK